MLALRNHRDVVARLHHFVGDHLHLFIHFVVAATHEALDGVNRVLGIGDGLPLGHLPDQPLASLGEADHRRRSPTALLVGDNLGLAAFHDGDH